MHWEANGKPAPPALQPLGSIEAVRMCVRLCCGVRLVVLLVVALEVGMRGRGARGNGAPSAWHCQSALHAHRALSTRPMHSSTPPARAKQPALLCWTHVLLGPRRLLRMFFKAWMGLAHIQSPLPCRFNILEGQADSRWQQLYDLAAGLLEQKVPCRTRVGAGTRF